jgi:hypothetical protein
MLGFGNIADISRGRFQLMSHGEKEDMRVVTML